MSSAVRQSLKAGTADTHDALDALWTGKSLSDPEHYVRFLESSAAALLPTEAALEASGVDRLLPDWPHRRRTDAIVADLAGFGRTPAHVPIVAESDIGRGAPAILGALYVLEGSRLGGALLLRDAEASADPAVRANHRYLRHGQGAGLWRSFLQCLDAAEPDEADLAAMVASARRTFARFDAAARAVLTLGETV